MGTPRPRAPKRIQAIRLLLLVQAVLVAALWLWVWRGLQGYAWTGGGVETNLFERGMSYLVVLAPTIPVNVLAVIWLGRGGRRAQLYLAGAGVLVAVQQILLLMPVDPGRSTAAGLIFAMAVGPVAFAGLALAVTGESKRWLGREHPASWATAESLVWAVAAIFTIGVTFSMGEWVEASTETGPPVGEHDESDAWPRMEEAVTGSAVSLDGFPGFERRTVEVTPCGYRTEAGLRTYRYWITYEFADFTEADAYLAAVRESWGAPYYEVLYDGTTIEGDVTITAHRDDELMLFLTMGEAASFEVQSGCLERVDAHVDCLEAQGGVMPERDSVEGLVCARED
ncbi:hypothetical protein L0U85_17310 [Glycomyces sp. L485]|uniref:hypothetical protein n=1 Tax=Glycomyces sp. L485 TaxID=2909235 RepID=UPI001F4AA673|nr:hypothetical protein [Glycomyces sp. L485]MCH7232598.1 hypothetical protein [Glycomyces sp. L485]